MPQIAVQNLIFSCTLVLSVLGVILTLHLCRRISKNIRTQPDRLLRLCSSSSFIYAVVSLGLKFVLIASIAEGSNGVICSTGVSCLIMNLISEYIVCFHILGYAIVIHLRHECIFNPHEANRHGLYPGTLHTTAFVRYAPLIMLFCSISLPIACLPIVWEICFLHQLPLQINWKIGCFLTYIPVIIVLIITIYRSFRILRYGRCNPPILGLNPDRHQFRKKTNLIDFTTTFIILITIFLYCLLEASVATWYVAHPHPEADVRVTMFRLRCGLLMISEIAFTLLLPIIKKLGMRLRCRVPNPAVVSKDYQKLNGRLTSSTGDFPVLNNCSPIALQVPRSIGLFNHLQLMNGSVLMNQPIVYTHSPYIHRSPIILPKSFYTYQLRSLSWPPDLTCGRTTIDFARTHQPLPQMTAV